MANLYKYKYKNIIQPASNFGSHTSVAIAIFLSFNICNINKSWANMFACLQSLIDMSKVADMLLLIK